MNTTLTISLPQTEATQIKRRAKHLGYPSVSQFMRERAAFADIDDGSDIPTMTTKEILQAGKEAKRLHQQGKLPVLRSLADWIND